MTSALGLEKLWGFLLLLLFLFLHWKYSSLSFYLTKAFSALGCLFKQNGYYIFIKSLFETPGLIILWWCINVTYIAAFPDVSTWHISLHFPILNFPSISRINPVAFVLHSSSKVLLKWIRELSFGCVILMVASIFICDTVLYTPWTNFTTRIAATFSEKRFVNPP